MSTWSSPRTAVLCGAALAALLSASRPARGIPPVPPFEKPTELRDVPIEGVVALVRHGDALAEITVQSMDGTQLAGETVGIGDRLVWRAAAPLTPSTRYRATIEDWQFELETAAGPAPTLREAPDVGEVLLKEREEPAHQVCCVNWDEARRWPCWSLSYDYVIDLVLTLKPVTSVDPRYVAERLVTPPTALRAARRVQERVFATFGGAQDEYCMEIEATDVVHGVVLTRSVCAAAASLIPAAVSAPQVPEPAQCVGGELYDLTRGEPYVPPADPAAEPPATDEGMCRAGSGGGGLLALLAIAGLLFVPRRRRVRRA